MRPEISKILNDLLKRDLNLYFVLERMKFIISHSYNRVVKSICMVHCLSVNVLRRRVWLAGPEPGVGRGRTLGKFLDSRTFGECKTS